MEVNFDNLRIKLARSYNCLVRALHTDMDDIGDIETNVRDLREYLEDIRNHTVTLLCIYDDKDEGVNDVSDKVKLLEFAPKES